MTKKTGNSGTDIYQLLLETSKKREKEKRARLLQSIGVSEYFEEGTIRIDMKTCKGTECELCIKACPTNALYWKIGQIGIVRELCVYCAACVLNCIVDDCIQVSRRRPNGETERFSTPGHALRIMHNINSQKRGDVVKSRRLREAILNHHMG